MHSRKCRVMLLRLKWRCSLVEYTNSARADVYVSLILDRSYRISSLDKITLWFCWICLPAMFPRITRCLYCDQWNAWNAFQKRTPPYNAFLWVAVHNGARSIMQPCAKGRHRAFARDLWTWLASLDLSIPILNCKLSTWSLLYLSHIGSWMKT